MRVTDVGGIDLCVESSISVSQGRGPPRDVPVALTTTVHPREHLNAAVRSGRYHGDKDPPLAPFEARVPVKLDVASWLRANPGPWAIFR